MGSPIDVEDTNRRIAYHHREDGCDVTGWDLTQMLRVPLTYNFKYDTPQQVKLVSFKRDNLYTLKDFNAYPELKQIDKKGKPARQLPAVLPNETAEQVLQAFDNSMHPRVWRLYKERPDQNWSSNMWDLELCLFEVGATPEQVFIVAKSSACNKFERDGLGDGVLWKEVLRAEEHFHKKGYGASVDNKKIVTSDRDILDDNERDIAHDYGTFIDQYAAWGTKASDAPSQYHIGGALVILSAIMSARLKLATSFGSIIPNMWVMLVSDTTLTRKSTTMDMAMDVITEITPNALMATDGSIEGIMQAMSLRAGVPSIMLRDEFSGLLEVMSSKGSYYSGMQEMLTKLYDNKPYRRQLKKETIEVNDPVFIMYTGGAKEKLYNLIQPSHISSGFFPRFVFIIADADFNKIKPLGPPTQESAESRIAIVDRVRDIHAAYNGSTFNQSMLINQYRDIKLTDKAWKRYNAAEEIMQLIGYHSGVDDLLTPMMTRLTISGLKIACLIAGSEQLDGDGPVTVEEVHIIKALSYVEIFKSSAMQIVNNTGMSTVERQLRRVLESVQTSVDGTPRSTLMQRHGLMAKDADIILSTLEQRGLIRVENKGAARVVKPV
jgi:hypothetical protein